MLAWKRKGEGEEGEGLRGGDPLQGGDTDRCSGGPGKENDMQWWLPHTPEHTEESEERRLGGGGGGGSGNWRGRRNRGQTTSHEQADGKAAGIGDTGATGGVLMGCAATPLLADDY